MNLLQSEDWERIKILIRVTFYFLLFKLPPFLSHFLMNHVLFNFLPNYIYKLFSIFASY